jgi:hypothetical protein
MRITRRPSTGVPGVEDAGGLAEPTAPPPRTGRPSEPGHGDRVEVSDAARLRQRLRTEVGDLDTVRSDRVAELRARVTTDDFRPPAHAVAERLLAEVAADLLV